MTTDERPEERARDPGMLHEGMYYPPLPEGVNEFDAARYWRYAEAAVKRERERSKDRDRLDWLGAHPRDASIRLPDGRFEVCKVWAISADARWSIREAIDAAIAQERG